MEIENRQIPLITVSNLIKRGVKMGNSSIIAGCYPRARVELKCVRMLNRFFTFREFNELNELRVELI